MTEQSIAASNKNEMKSSSSWREKLFLPITNEHEFKKIETFLKKRHEVFTGNGMSIFYFIH